MGMHCFCSQGTRKSWYKLNIPGNLNWYQSQGNATGLQKLLNIYELFAKVNDIIYDVNNSVCMYMKPPKCKLKAPAVYLDGTIMSYVEKYKYLGCVIINDFNDYEDIK